MMGIAEEPRIVSGGRSNIAVIQSRPIGRGKGVLARAFRSDSPGPRFFYMLDIFILVLRP
jgi:hypothetical protein